MSGKWHATPNNGKQHNWTVRRGFDRFYGIIAGAVSYWRSAVSRLRFTAGRSSAAPRSTGNTREIGPWDEVRKIQAADAGG